MIHIRTALDNIIIFGIIVTIILASLPFSNLEHIGLIWCTVLGLIMGSYATSLISRLPRKVMQKKENPYCASCKTPLAVQDLYTVFSYIINKGRCRFCHEAIPRAIFSTETLITLNYLVCYFFYDKNLYQYLAATSFYSSVIIAATLWFNSRYVSVWMISVMLASASFCYFAV